MGLVAIPCWHSGRSLLGCDPPKLTYCGRNAMPTGDQLKTLIESFASGDEARFYRTALQTANLTVWKSLAVGA